MTRSTSGFTDMSWPWRAGHHATPRSARHQRGQPTERAPRAPRLPRTCSSTPASHASRSSRARALRGACTTQRSMWMRSMRGLSKTDDRLRSSLKLTNSGASYRARRVLTGNSMASKARCAGVLRGDVSVRGHSVRLAGRCSDHHAPRLDSRALQRPRPALLDRAIEENVGRE